jgi:K+-sensing histidine kinase KdpD
MNAPSVEVSSQDISQTRADRGRAENLVQETITRFGIWTPRWQLASLQRTLLFTGFAWLIIAVIVLRFTLASVTTDVLAFLAAAVIGFFAHDATGRTEQRARAAAAGATGPTAEADRMRAALLAAVSHDLRSPLAAAAAAVSCLRSPDLKLTPADQDELLATAEESLDLLSRLAATLLDVTRLQAGARSVFPRPADLEEIIVCSLASLGPSGRTVRVDLPLGLPKVVADPPVMERVIANLTANALRYSPAGSPPRLTASARSGQIELHVIDCGPGVPLADRERMFAPFQRLSDADSTTDVGLGLGLAISRGLTEAMRGTLQPAQTPGGGLTMTMSLPAAPRLTQADLPGCRPQGLDREARYRFVTRPDPPWNFRIGHLGQGRQSARCADSTLDPMNSSRSTSKAGAPAARRLARSPSAGLSAPCRPAISGSVT